MLISIMIIIVLLVLFLSQKMIINNWIDPSIVCILYWAFFIIASIIVFQSEYNWNYWSLIWMIMALISFCGGHLISLKIQYLKKEKIEDRIKLYGNKAWIILLSIIVLGIVRTFIEMSINGINLKQLTNLEALIGINTYIASMRYSEGTASTPLMQILSVFTYTAPLIGGYMLLKVRNKVEKLICFATFIPILLSVVLTNGKAGFIASFFLFISGFLVKITEKKKSIKKFNFKRLILIFSILILVISILIIAMMLRIGEFNIDTLNIVFKKFLIYAFGHMQAFDNWFNVMDKNVCTFGGYTFMAIFKNLGLIERIRGVYEPVEGVYSNVFTAYRGIIHDFGIIGSIFFIFVSGLISGYFYGHLKSKKKLKLISPVVVSSIYFFIFYSFIISPWTYTSYSLVFLVFFLYLWITRKYGTLG